MCGTRVVHLFFFPVEGMLDASVMSVRRRSVTPVGDRRQTNDQPTQNNAIWCLGMVSGRDLLSLKRTSHLNEINHGYDITCSRTVDCLGYDFSWCNNSLTLMFMMARRRTAQAKGFSTHRGFLPFDKTQQGRAYKDRQVQSVTVRNDIRLLYIRPCASYAPVPSAFIAPEWQPPRCCTAPAEAAS